MRVLLFGMSPANAHFLIHILWLVVSTKCKIILQSPLVTDLGEWGSMDRCPNGTYVVGMQLKVEQEQPFLHDDSALNGIRLFCVGLSENFEDTLPKIESSVGGSGRWQSELFCNSGLVVGFQLRSESFQQKHDDTGANNLRIICSDGQIIQGEGTSWGDWTGTRQCRKRQAVCSIQTQVQGPQVGGDETGLNNVRLECCNIPNPLENCRPTDFWEVVAECDNTNAFTPTTCTYERKIGMDYTDTQLIPSINPQEKSILASIGFSLDLAAQIVSRKFKFGSGLGKQTGYNWASSRISIWSQESTTTVSFDVPPGIRSSMVQVVGSCGNSLVRTAKFQRIDKLGEPLRNINGSDIHWILQHAATFHKHWKNKPWAPSYFPHL